MPRPPRATAGLSRRAFLQNGLRAAGTAALALGSGGLAQEVRAAAGGADSFGPLGPPDANGLRLPPGFSSRIVATSNLLVAATGHTWHRNPDGGATFATGDGGWVYVSNSERDGGNGGVGAIRFAADGAIVAAYPILAGTSRNCAGGPTPWGTWLSCEEVNGGRVFDCDPLAPGSQGSVCAALGTFNHEAAAVDPVHQRIYLTEDQSNGRLYRATPSLYPAPPRRRAAARDRPARRTELRAPLATGLLEAAQILDPLGQGPIQPGQVRPLAWHAVAEPNPVNGGVQNPNHLPLEQRATRYQVPGASAFSGGEGCWYEAGLVHFSTKGDNRIWTLDPARDTIEIRHDFATTADPDNVYASPLGDVYVAEDPGQLRIIALTLFGDVKPVVQLTGVSGTELTGPALSPDGQRLYFSSQSNPGATYEVTGPFAPVGSVPALGSAGRMLFAAALGLASAFALRGRRARGSDAPRELDYPRATTAPPRGGEEER